LNLAKHLERKKDQDNPADTFNPKRRQQVIHKGEENGEENDTQNHFGSREKFHHHRLSKDIEIIPARLELGPFSCIQSSGHGNQDNHVLPIKANIRS